MVHPVDRAAGVALSLAPQGAHLFSDGWGEPHAVDLASLTNPSHRPIRISWLTKTNLIDGTLVEYGGFTSPITSLPPRSRVGSVISVAPAKPTNRVVVLMAAWNEHNPKVRVAMARLLAHKGVRSIILEHPFYGSRRPTASRSQPIRTVADFMTMGEAAVAEARSVLMSLHDDGWHVGVAGYSMGGNTAALVSAIMPAPTATAPLAASHSPGPVFLDGVLRAGIAWDALGGLGQEQKLRAMFDTTSVLNAQPAPHSKHAVIVRASDDGYIPKDAVQSLANHWVGSDLRVVNGGHATAIWFRKHELTDAIVDSFNRLEAASATR